MYWRVLSVILIGQSGIVEASNWVEIGTTRSGSVMSIDTDSVKIEKTYSGNIVTAWFETDYTNDKSVAERSAKSLEQFRCTEREVNLKYLITYDAAGNVVKNFNRPRQEFIPVVPDTTGEMKMIWACTLAGEFE
jgi:small-conductance mechanosensitive channel